jgi:hypothetical protein
LYVQVQLLGQPRQQAAHQPRLQTRRRPSNTAAKNGKVQVPKVQVLKVQVPKVQIQKVQRKNERKAATAKTTTSLNIWGNLRVKTLELDLDTQVLDLDMLALDLDMLALDLDMLELDTLALDTLDQLDQLDHRHQEPLLQQRICISKAREALGVWSSRHGLMAHTTTMWSQKWLQIEP